MTAAKEDEVWSCPGSATADWSRYPSMRLVVRFVGMLSTRWAIAIASGEVVLDVGGVVASTLTPGGTRATDHGPSVVLVRPTERRGRD